MRKVVKKIKLQKDTYFVAEVSYFDWKSEIIVRGNIVTEKKIGKMAFNTLNPTEGYREFLFKVDKKSTKQFEQFCEIDHTETIKKAFKHCLEHTTMFDTEPLNKDYEFWSKNPHGQREPQSTVQGTR